METLTDRRKLMTLLIKPAERDLLDQICEQEGGTSRSAVVRKLIAQEASRRNINGASMINAGSEPAQVN